MKYHSLFQRLPAVLLAAGWMWGLPLVSQAQDFNLDTDYQNYWIVPDLGTGPYQNYFDTNTPASSAVYNGSVFGSPTNLTTKPSHGPLMLYSSALGQPAAFIPSDVSIGDVIPTPAGFPTNLPPANFVPVQVGDNPNAYYQSPNGGAFYVPSTGQVIAAQPNSTTIVWTNYQGNAGHGYTFTQVINVSDVPTRRPSILFWTETPYDAPPVDLSGKFFAIHYNSRIPKPVTQIVTNTAGGTTYFTTNIIKGVWFDSSKQLHAVGVTGTFLIEFYRDGTYTKEVQPTGVEVVRVEAPNVNVVSASMGQRLLPLDSYWANTSGANGVIPDVSRSDPSAVLVYANQGPKLNWAFPLRRTWMDPWDLEIYWKQTGLMGVQWPYEVDWYSVNWPADPQTFVIGDNGSQDEAPVLIPSDELNATLASDMEPGLSAHLSDDGTTFTASEPGYSMLEFQNQTNIWFDVIHAVSHTNDTYFDLTPVTWPIGQELYPGNQQSMALEMGGNGDYLINAGSYVNRRYDWTLSLRFDPAATQNATLYSEGSSNQPSFNVNLTTNGQVQVEVWNRKNGAHAMFTTTNAAVQPNLWHSLTVAYNGLVGMGKMTVHLDADSETTNGMPRVWFDTEDQSLLGAESVSPVTNFFRGKLAKIRLWGIVLNAFEILTNRFSLTPELPNNLIAWFPCNAGRGPVVYNLGGGDNFSLMGNTLWTAGEYEPTTNYDGFPGYIHTAEGTRYNVDYYDYPTASSANYASHVFAVNTGKLEVWWATRSRNTDMPAVYYPSRVVRYTNVWPANPSQIIIASGLGSNGKQPIGAPAWDPLQALNPSVYYQNDPSQDGYNPNEEHAQLLDGVVYALRDDLNQSNSSAPYVLVDYTQASNSAPSMHVFQVLATNADYQFERNLTAGLPIIPILPLSSYPPAPNTYSDTTPPAWRDRKMEWWAASGGDAGGTTNAVMHFYYPVQPGFYFPALSASNQPPVGTEVPWLPTPGTVADGGASGVPIPFTYRISWPTNAPKLELGQTLTVAQNGLPDVWDQLSVAVLYQQSEYHQDSPNQTTPKDSVQLFDPLVAYKENLDSAVIDAMTSANLASVDVASGDVRFPNLPPSLYPRIYYDKTDSQLILEGQRVTPVTGTGYLLLNMLDPSEQAQVEATAAGIDPGLKAKWDAAVASFPTNVTPIEPNQKYVKAALGALLSDGSGYVTLAFNNSTNTQQVPTASPISLSIIKVDTNLYSGELEVIKPADALAEELSLRVSPDFSGLADQCDFRWRDIEPVGGQPPNTNFYTWDAYGPDLSPGTNEVTISGASPFTLADHYFAVQYRPISRYGPSGTNWSDWSYNLAPGWVVRAMTGINPFMQTYQDVLNHAVDTRSTMIEAAGGPYEGDIALTLDAANEYGLIPTYETIFHRAMEFSLLAGISDSQVNQTLLFAASRLNDLYDLLGNEAFANAEDPAVPYPQDLSSAGSYLGANGTSLFAFMNQEPNELEQELALLRGRDDTLEPGVETPPVYNRLYWNFTQGINGGEAAYAYTYNITGSSTNTAGTITEADAKRLYPQGHGDAWGYYLSALQHYYELLSYTNFQWNTEPGATLVGNASVSVDYYDEQKFAESAAALARTGAKIVQDTFCENYSEEPIGHWPAYHDSNTNRAWGIAGWASRAGQSALYNWATANSLMVTTLTNLTQINPSAPNRPPEGIEKIDRDSTPELQEITGEYKQIQQDVDNANGGLNPLGLAKDEMPFDISPAEIDAGQTYFDQIYARALQAVHNAAIAYDNARTAGQQLRKQYNSVYQMTAALDASEILYHNRLISIYGYPYSDDIGPGGNYPQGYDGPDLIDWRIVDLKNLVANAPTNTQTLKVSIYNLGFVATNVAKGTLNDLTSTNYKDYLNNQLVGVESSNYLTNITITVNSDALQVKPASWTGSRKAQGQLQLAIADYVQAWYGLVAKKTEYEQTLQALQNEILHRQEDYASIPYQWQQYVSNNGKASVTAGYVNKMKNDALAVQLTSQFIKECNLFTAESLPKEILGFNGPYPVAEAGVSTRGALVQVLAEFVQYSETVVAQSMTIAANTRSANQQKGDLSLAMLLQNYAYQSSLQWPTLNTEADLQNQYVKLADLESQLQAVQQDYQKIQKLLAQGQRYLEQRAQVRARAAEEIQSARYADLDLRVFQNDALRQYDATFNLAARYVYLAAKAYDYETGLLNTGDNATNLNITPGQQFLQEVVRARLPGRFSTWLGTPLVGATSDGSPGLADILARMKADWDVAKGRFGFNNPDHETTRFSLRTGLFRIVPGAGGDANWAQELEDHEVTNLNDLPVFRRYCRPFADPTNVEPGIVISFPSYIMAGMNFFGRDLAGGDNAYDPSRAVTKIRSVGVWFTNYNGTNGSVDSLANDPLVYLIPAGADVMRSPTGNVGDLRVFHVLDQAIPLPYNIGGMNIDSPDWSPMVDSLQEPFAEIRRFSSFRAYHDEGYVDPSETVTDSRLIGRSVWNTQWVLIIPGQALLSDPSEGLQRFIYGGTVNGKPDDNGVKDIKIYFQTYSISGD